MHAPCITPSGFIPLACLLCLSWVEEAKVVPSASHPFCPSLYLLRRAWTRARKAASSRQVSIQWADPFLAYELGLTQSALPHAQPAPAPLTGRVTVTHTGDFPSGNRVTHSGEPTLTLLSCATVCGDPPLEDLLSRGYSLLFPSTVASGEVVSQDLISTPGLNLRVESPLRTPSGHSDLRMLLPFIPRLLQLLPHLLRVRSHVLLQSLYFTTSSISSGPYPAPNSSLSPPSSLSSPYH
ncbi:hypothetical protein Pcinc_041789 [Petrolisthes cinctipes]|uniref:Uncharacterized protein n=1 Tax=Petrolisthes cinctipes TaxID=88211 RepID=A0AAE1BMJ8_PETCI|nr:hypothetical protein Pcinc_041789 [Petrolisthes cinctipes]